MLLKPDVMWKTCKNSQLEMESELFKFRAECGDYADTLPMSQVVES